MMSDFENKYKQIENELIPIINFLENHKEEFREEYKGFCTLLSPLVQNPEILFLGYNMGEGAYREKNKPVRRLYGNYTKLWYKKGDARGAFNDKENKEDWQDYEWYERDAPVNNTLSKNMIDLLYEVADPEKKSEKNKLPFWYHDFGQKIMFTNLYPIATTNIKDLAKIHQTLSEKKELLALWKPYQKNGERIDNWVVRKFFLAKIRKMIELVRPKIIVCLGKSTMSDFTYGKFDEKDKIYFGKEKVYDSTVLGFNRSGNWSGIIPKLAKQIIDNQMK